MQKYNILSHFHSFPYTLIPVFLLHYDAGLKNDLTLDK